MTEQQFKGRLKAWIDTSVERGVVACRELMASEEFELMPKDRRLDLLRTIFSDVIVPYAVVALRAKWGGVEQFEQDGLPALRGMIPVDQFSQRAVPELPGRTLDRATRAYFDA